MIPVTATMNVAWLKQEISRRSGQPASNFKIVFAGTKLKDDQTLADFGLTSCSTLHLVPERHGNIEMVPDQSAMLSNKDLLLLPGTDRGSPATPHPDRFYVFCKQPCNQMRPGKLRVRCSQCKHGGFLLERGPEGWEDVLTPGKLHGQCSMEGCQGKTAEFFFKCAVHVTSEEEACVALHMVRANTVGVNCLSCLSTPNLVVMFTCHHCVCIECFQGYCSERLTTRRFERDASIGYTIKCPAGCPGSEVREVHHFRILGPELYDRYQRFGTEEFVLQMGGVLCPQPHCGMGLLPEDQERKVDCPREIGGCGFVFCRECKDPYHSGPCMRHTAVVVNTQQEVAVDQAALHRAQWEERETGSYIQQNTKLCPRCKVPVEKNGGCMHMTCRCKFEWCWICETQWNGECQSSHWFG